MGSGIKFPKPKKKQGQGFFVFLILTSSLLVLFLFVFGQKRVKEIEVSSFYSAVVEAEFFDRLDGIAPDDADTLKRDLRIFFDNAQRGDVDKAVLWKVIIMIGDSLRDNELSAGELDKIMTVLAEYRP